MNIVFFGSGNFAAPSLRALIENKYRISCVVTQPDRKKGRGLEISGTPVKALAQSAGLEIYQPEKVNSRDSVGFLKALSPDLFIVIAYGQILSGEVLRIPKIFSLNVHGSLLPKYRGAAPINRALIKGEKETGVTIIKMAEEMDAGPVILSEPVRIQDSDDAITLEARLSHKAAALLIKSLKLIEDKNYYIKEQDSSQVSFAPSLKKDDGLINWERPAQDIYNLIRGCLGWPGAFTYYKGRLLKVYKAGFEDGPADKITGMPGEIIQASKDGIVVATGKGKLIIEELQIEGKKKMSVEVFFSGHKIQVKELLGKKSLH